MLQVDGKRCFESGGSGGLAFLIVLAGLEDVALELVGCQRFSRTLIDRLDSLVIGDDADDDRAATIGRVAHVGDLQQESTMRP